MPWNRRYGAQNFWRELAPMLDKRPHEIAPRLAVFAQRRCRFAQVPLQNDCRPIVEGMRQRRGRVYPFESIITQRQGREEWRACAQRMHGRSKIMQKARQCQLESARSAAGNRL